MTNQDITQLLQRWRDGDRQDPGAGTLRGDGHEDQESRILGQRLATSADINGNAREEGSLMAKRLSDDQRIIQVRDFDDGTKTGNIFP